MRNSQGAFWGITAPVMRLPQKNKGEAGGRVQNQDSRRVMRRIWRTFSVWAVLLGGLVLWPTANLVGDPPKDNGNAKDKESDKKKEKVTICHKGQTIEVPKPALQAHLNHGDTLGPCSITPSQNR